MTARCVQEFFEEQVRRTPDAPALISGDERLGFSALNRHANRIAHRLRRHGAGADTLVGLAVERSFGMVAALLGILKAGAAYVPLDPAYLEERARAILEDARVCALITESRHLDRLPPGGAGLICLDTESGSLAAEDDTNLPAGDEESLAHVIYTSGTTGLPKGVLGTHRAEVNRLRWMWRRFPYEPGETACLKTSVNFIDCFSELFWPLPQGVPVVMVPPEPARVPRRLAGILAEHRVTRLILTPSLLASLLDGHRDPGPQLPALKYCMSCGEALSWELAQRFRRAMPHCRLINLYGATEACADVTCYEAGEERPGGSVPIGRSVANMSVLLLDEESQPVPLGATGELYVAGPGLARGYLNRPELTAERFLPHPYGASPGERIFRTGDRARFLPGGDLELLGRVDHQVKIRGFRVEPGEVEAALVQYPGVRAAVVAPDEVPGGTRLVACVVAGEGERPRGEDLAAFLRRRLPDYMIPAAFVALDRLPLNSNGKVDRAALPPPDRTPGERNAPQSLPETPTEERLAAIWRRVLSLERIGIDDDFFLLGGDSLSALAMILEVESACRVAVPVQFFAAPTIANLGRLLSGGRSTGEAGTVVHAPPGGRRRGVLEGWRDRAELSALRLPYRQGLARLRRWCGSTLVQALFYRREAGAFRRFCGALDESAPAGTRTSDTRPGRCTALVSAALARHFPAAAGAWPPPRSYDFLASHPFWSAAAPGGEGRLPSCYLLEGGAPLRRLRDRHRGVILLTYHTALFPLLAPALDCLDFDPVRLVSMNRIYRSRGTPFTGEEDGSPDDRSAVAELTHDLATVLSAGGLAVLAGDGRKGTIRRHLPAGGRLYPFRSGFAELALSTGAAVIPMSCTLSPEGFIRLVLHPEIQPGGAATSRAAQVGGMLAQYAAFLDAAWREAPESLSATRMERHLRLPPHQIGGDAVRAAADGSRVAQSDRQ